MDVWLSMFLVIFMARFLINKADKNPETRDKKFLIFAGVVIVFVMGSRSATVTSSSDVNNYYRWYLNAPKTSWGDCFEHENIEAGYLLLNKFLASVIRWPQFIVYFEATFVTFFALRAIYKYTESVFIGLICYLCMGNFIFALTGFRQAIAISICLYAIDFLIEKKNIRFVILVLLARTIHQTAIVFLPIVVFANWKLDWKRILLMVIIMVILSISMEKIMQIGNEAFEREYTDEFVGNFIGGIINLMIYGLAVFLPILNNYSILGSLARKLSALISIGIIGIGVYAMRFQSLVVERIALYFIMVMPLLMTHGLTYVRMKNANQKKLMQITACTLLILLFMYRVDSTIGAEYTFFWEGNNLVRNLTSLGTI